METFRVADFNEKVLMIAQNGKQVQNSIVHVRAFKTESEVRAMLYDKNNAEKVAIKDDF